MELTPAKLIIACGAIFAGIVAIGMATQFKDAEQLKSSLTNITDLSQFRNRLIREEGTPEVDAGEEYEEQTTPSED